MHKAGICFPAGHASAPPKVSEPERITHTAIKGPHGITRILPIPASHYEVSRRMLERGIKEPLKYEQGFVTDRGRFVDREEAMKIARAAEQRGLPRDG